jgi:transcriptional regulator with XRE-family HTH domain
MSTIAKMMEKADITLTELAYKLGVREHTVWRWRSGKSQPRAEHVQKLAKLLGVTSDELLRSLWDN